MIVGYSQRHQLIEVDFIRPIKLEQSGRNIGELEPLAHSDRGNAESGCDLLESEAVRNELLEGRKLISRMHRLANSVFRQAALCAGIPIDDSAR